MTDPSKVFVNLDPTGGGCTCWQPLGIATGSYNGNATASSSALGNVFPLLLIIIIAVGVVVLSGSKSGGR